MPGKMFSTIKVTVECAKCSTFYTVDHEAAAIFHGSLEKQNAILHSAQKVAIFMCGHQD